MFLKIITLLLFLSISFTFNINTTQTHNYHYSNQTCTNQELNKIMIGVNSCAYKYLLDNFVCIVNFLGQNFDKQWDVFIQSTTSPDAIYFWSFNKCVVKLNNYGSYNRTIYIWEVEKQQSHQISSKNKIFDFNNKQMNVKNIVETSLKPYLMSQDDECPSYKILAVQSAISSCDIEGNNNAALCISNKVDSKIGQKWGTMVKTDGDSMASIWIYGNCWVNAMNVGVYKRTINVWKAEV